MDTSKYILLIEDDEVDAMTIKRILKSIGIENRIVHKLDGQEGLDYLIQTAELPGLILVDLNMPRMNGREFIEAMRKHENLSKIQIVALSTSDTDGDIVNGNVVDYIVKCIGLDEFSDSLEKSMKKIFSQVSCN